MKFIKIIRLIKFYENFENRKINLYHLLQIVLMHNLEKNYVNAKHLAFNIKTKKKLYEFDYSHLNFSLIKE